MQEHLQVSLRVSANDPIWHLMQSFLKLFKSPRLILLFAVLCGIILYAALQATETACTTTANGFLNDPKIYGEYEGSVQNADCGVDLSLNYEVASATAVSWQGNGGPLMGT